jgi:NADH-quinone oxidoreductase subunit A
MDIFFLQANTLPAANLNNSISYFPVGVQFLFAIGFVVMVLAVGNARRPMAINYFLVAILFVLFDVEVIFFYPYAVNFRELGWAGFSEVLLFVAFFLAGFLYIIKKGALNWED